MSLRAMRGPRVLRLMPLETLLPLLPLLPLLLGTRPQGERLLKRPVRGRKLFGGGDWAATGYNRKQRGRDSLYTALTRARPWARVLHPRATGGWTHPQSSTFRSQELDSGPPGPLRPCRQSRPTAVLLCWSLGDPQLLLGTSGGLGDPTCAVSPESEIVSTLEWFGETEAREVATRISTG